MAHPEKHHLPPFVSTVGLTEKLARVVADSFHVTTSLGWPDCGPVFLDDEQAVENLNEKFTAVLAAPTGHPSHGDAVLAQPASDLVAALETLEYRPGTDYTERVAMLDSLLFRLNFERRLAALAPNQRDAMRHDLSDEKRARIDACETEAQRKELFHGMARTRYMLDCAWKDYLHGISKVPPVPAIVPKPAETPELATV